MLLLLLRHQAPTGAVATCKLHPRAGRRAMPRRPVAPTSTQYGVARFVPFFPDSVWHRPHHPPRRPLTFLPGNGLTSHLWKKQIKETPIPRPARTSSSVGGENGVFCRVGAWRSRGWCDGERFALVPISCSRIVHHAVSALELFIQQFARRLCSGCRFALTSDHAFVVQEFSGGRQRFTCSADTIFIQGPAATGAFQGFPFTA